jgi:hypothetical protein
MRNNRVFKTGSFSVTVVRGLILDFAKSFKKIARRRFFRILIDTLDPDLFLN